MVLIEQLTPTLGVMFVYILIALALKRYKVF